MPKNGGNSIWPRSVFHALFAGGCADIQNVRPIESGRGQGQPLDRMKPAFAGGVDWRGERVKPGRAIVKQGCDRHWRGPIRKKDEGSEVGGSGLGARSLQSS